MEIIVRIYAPKSEAMIAYYKHNEINREQWDNCVKNSPGVKPYGYSWYLDLVSPGWEALIDDDYDSVFPLPGSKKYGINYITTPVFLQQLGVYSPDKSENVAINDFLYFIPDKYRFIDLCVAQEISIDGYKVFKKANFELKLSDSYEKIREGFSTHCKRNIEHAMKYRPELVYSNDPDELIDLFIRNKGRDIKGIKTRDYKRLKDLMNYCLDNKRGRIIGVRNERKRLIYGIFIVETPGNITMLFVVNTTQSREQRIGYYVVNELIKIYASTGTVIDFAGSSVPSIASFMKSFGSAPMPYYRLYRNNLFWPVRTLK